MRSAAEAVAYARALHSLVRWIGICDGNMQEGSFRCDANVSVRPKGTEKLGTRCEIKNLNSFRFMEKAIEHEVRRQIELIGEGGAVVQETRLYDPDRDETRPMRSKEDAQDYRYFPDPDLLPLVVSPAMIEAIRGEMGEVQHEARSRLALEYNLSGYDAWLVTSDRQGAAYFEKAIEALEPGDKSAGAKQLVNWMFGELAAANNEIGVAISDSPVPAAALARLVQRGADGTLSSKMMKVVFAEMHRDGSDADTIIAKQGLRQLSDPAAIEAAVDRVLAANAKQVEDYRAGKEKAFNSLVGQVMKATAGKANPAQVNDILRRKLAG
jgi:aspartyl-tRNA(Asn)/glutamyl-tRNA(Gln) amidotransferase subunit B